jgi:hypothetical protein
MSLGLACPEMVSDYFPVVLTAVLLVLWLLLVRRGQSRFPPGPRGWPLIGMALNHPKSEYWKTYARWGREYGAWHPTSAGTHSQDYHNRG